MGRVKEGSPINLSFKMEDGETGLFLRVLLKNAAGTLFATKTLTDVGNGVYQDNSEPMPATPYVTADAEAFTDALFANKYSAFPGFERFDLDTTTADLATQITASSNDSGAAHTLEVVEEVVILESIDDNTVLEVIEDATEIETSGEETELEAAEDGTELEVEETDTELNLNCED